MDNREQAGGVVVTAPTSHQYVGSVSSLRCLDAPTGETPIHSFILYLPYIQNFTMQDGNDMGLKKK